MLRLFIPSGRFCRSVMNQIEAAAVSFLHVFQAFNGKFRSQQAPESLPLGGAEAGMR